MPMHRDHLTMTVRTAAGRGVLPAALARRTLRLPRMACAVRVDGAAAGAQAVAATNTAAVHVPAKPRESRGFPGAIPGGVPAVSPAVVPVGLPQGPAQGLLQGTSQGLPQGRSTWTIHDGDALRLLATLPSDQVAAVITDPPYSSGGAMRSDRMGATSRKYTMGGTLTHRSDFAGDNRDQRSFGYWSALWLAEALRVTKPGGVCLLFTDWRQLPVATDALQAGGWIWRGIVPWDKTESARPDKGRFRTQCEYVVWGSKGPLGVAPPDAPCLPGVIRARVCRSDKHHIAGKPTEVMRALVRIAWQGGIVLDPFCGSGTTGVAAIEAGLDFIGFEAVAAYADVARTRCAQATANVAMSAAMTSSAINPVSVCRARNPVPGILLP